MALNAQQQAINRITGKNVIVSASAGTGKTTVLTARIIGYLQDERNDISEYLIVSFTEAAAGELKDRISSELKKFIDAETSPSKKQHYLNQLAKIPVANISTIHSFCLDILKKYGYVLGIDPAVAGRLANEGQLKQFRDRAFRKALDLRRHNELVYRMLDRPEDLSELQKTVEQIDRFKENLTDYEAWKNRQLAMYEKMAAGDFGLNPMDVKKRVKDQITELHERGAERLEIYYSAVKSGKNYDALRGFETVFEDFIGKIRALAEDGKYEDVSKQCEGLISFPTPRGKSPLDEDAKEDAKYAKNAYDDLLKELKKYYRFNEANRNNGPVVRELLEISEKYREVYNQLKTENNVIGFEDMLEKAKAILDADGGRVAEIYRNRFKEIMVDEYQDTNQNQENIIRSIARDNVFRVGDVKQSIYKFQNAKPEMMKQFIDHPGENDRVMPLQFNYRSHKSILDFSNFLFNRLMNLKKGTYTKEDDLLFPEVNAGKAGDLIHLVTAPFQSDETAVKNGKEAPAKKYGAKEKTAYIAEYIASEMCRLKKENSALKWSDFTVLLRGNKYKRLFKKVLSDHNIPVFTTAKTGFFSDAAVSTVISLLNLVVKDSPLDALNVLSGLMFRIRFETIASHPELLRVEEENGSELNKLVHELRRYAENHTLSELTDRIYNYRGFYMEQINSFQRSNLDSLYQMVLDFQKENNRITDLITYFSVFKTVDREEASSFISKDDVVQIMTIHQSKGLQFRYVFLADLVFKPGAGKYNGLVNLHEKAGIAPKYISLPYKVRHENPYYDYIREISETEDFEEELRILYVAVTRAVESLTVVNAADFKEEDADLSVTGLKGKGMMTWIKTALTHCPPDIRSVIDVRRYSEEDLRNHYEAAPKTVTEEKTQRKFSRELRETDIKPISPSSLEAKDLKSLNFYAKPGSERGTIMHKAIELLGIREVSVEEIEKLPLELSKEDREKIFAFYQNPMTKAFMNRHNEHEYPFVYLEKDRFVNGIIDWLSVGEDAAVIDFKSDRNTSEEKLRNRYTAQLTAYKDIVSKLYPDKEIKARIYSFELEKYVEVL
ncbi:MAG: UvrD-helicase domain-containing protein [Erysipelotrichales bacterium]|nr:UvrD-helicase domain-containing protein [Erysipelotrichales bacterium]